MISIKEKSDYYKKD